MHAEPRQSQTAPADTLALILDAVKTVLKTRSGVLVPEAGIDLVFDAGVVARCQACGVSWHVARTQYKARHWWACPSGCHRLESA
jgi:hypothetical protein